MCIHLEAFEEKRVLDLEDRELRGRIAVHDNSSGPGKAMVYRISGFFGLNNSILVVDNLSAAPRYNRRTGENLSSQIILRLEHEQDRIIYSERIMEEMINLGLDTQHLSEYRLRICKPLGKKLSFCSTKI